MASDGEPELSGGDEQDVGDVGSDAMAAGVSEEEEEEEEGGAGEGGGKGRGRARSRSSKGGGKGRCKAATKAKAKGRRQCQACFVLFPTETFPMNSKYDVDCKRALNVIYNAAVRQESTDWYYEQTSNPKAMKKLMTNYFAIHPKNKKNVRPPVRLLQLKETVTVSKMTDRDDVGEMMHIDAFVHFAGKKKNLGMPDLEATVLFQKLCKMPGAVTDNSGPHKDRPQRVLVSTKTLVTYRNRLSKAKSYDLVGKTTKKASQDDIDKAFSGLTQ